MQYFATLALVPAFFLGTACSSPLCKDQDPYDVYAGVSKVDPNSSASAQRSSITERITVEVTDQIDTCRVVIDTAGTLLASHCPLGGDDPNNASQVAIGATLNAWTEDGADRTDCDAIGRRAQALINGDQAIPMETLADSFVVIDAETEYADGSADDSALGFADGFHDDAALEVADGFHDDAARTSTLAQPSSDPSGLR